MAYLGNSPEQYTRRKFQFTATDSQTVFTGLDSNGHVLKYQDGNLLDVYLNGILLKLNDDYTITQKNTVTLTVGASLNDVLEIIAYGLFSVADTVSATEGGRFSGPVTFSGQTTFVSIEVPQYSNLNVITANSAQLSNATISRSDDSNSSLLVIQTSNGGALFVQGSSASTIEVLSDGATIIPNFGSNNNFDLTIFGNRTVENPINYKPGQSGVIYIQQGIGSNTIVWGNVWRFTTNTAPTLSTSNGAVDAVVYSVKNTSSIVASVIYDIG